MSKRSGKIAAAATTCRHLLEANGSVEGIDLGPEQAEGGHSLFRPGLVDQRAQTGPDRGAQAGAAGLPSLPVELHIR